MTVPAQFPTQIWDGSSRTRSGDELLGFAEGPDPIDWDQITAEMIAVQEFVLSSHLTIGDPIIASTIGSILFVSSIGELGQDNNNLFYDSATKSIGLGTNTLDPAAKLQINSTTQGILGPRLTETEQNAITSPPAGLTIFNTTINTLAVFDGFNWISIQGLLFDHFL